MHFVPFGNKSIYGGAHSFDSSFFLEAFDMFWVCLYHVVEVIVSSRLLHVKYFAYIPSLM